MSPAQSSPTDRRRLYVPTWWERRFPWMLDLLCAIDPDPILARLAHWIAPATLMLGRCAEPPAAAMEAVGRAARTIRASWADGLARGLRALPLLSALRRWLWLEPPRLRDDGVDSAPLALRRQDAVHQPLLLIFAAAVHATVLVLSPTISTPRSGSWPMSSWRSRCHRRWRSRRRPRPSGHRRRP